MTDPARDTFLKRCVNELWRRRYAEPFLSSDQIAAALAAECVENVAMAIGIHCPGCDSCTRDRDIPWQAALPEKEEA
jgi:hypothetical protein